MDRLCMLCFKDDNSSYKTKTTFYNSEGLAHHLYDKHRCEYDADYDSDVYKELITDFDCSQCNKTLYIEAYETLPAGVESDHIIASIHRTVMEHDVTCLSCGDI